MCKTLPFFYLFCACFFVNALNAQVLNADRVSSADTMSNKRFDLVFSGSLSFDKQTNNLADANLNADYSLYLNRNRWVFIGLSNIDLTTNGKEVIQNAGFIHFRFRDNNRLKIAPELFAQLQWNGNLGLLSRKLVGCNYRAILFKSESHLLTCGLGAFDEIEFWQTGADDKGETITRKFERLKLNSYLKYSGKIATDVILSIGTFYQTRPLYLGTGRISGEIKTDFAVSEKLSVSIGFSGIYDIQPVAPIDHFYYGIKNTINFSL